MRKSLSSIIPFCLWAALLPTMAGACNSASDPGVTVQPVASKSAAEPGLDPDSALIVSPAVLALGTLRPGEAAQGTLTLRNPHSEAITVESLETSCPCVRVSPSPARVEPRQTVTLTVTFDPKEEPDFRGALAVECLGKKRDGALLFRGRVDLEVSDKPAPRPDPETSIAPVRAGSEG